MRAVGGGHPAVRTNLSRRLLLWAGLPTTVLFGAVVLIASLRTQRRLIDETEQVARGIADSHAAKIEQKLSGPAKIPEDIALTLERGVFTTEKELESYLREVVARHDDIYGSCIA